MSAFVIADIEVLDAKGFDAYRAQVPPIIARFGGRYVVRGGNAEALEGAWAPTRVVVLEFPDRAAARAWWSSHDYADAKALRQRCARTQLIIVDGV